MPKIKVDLVRLFKIAGQVAAAAPVILAAAKPVVDALKKKSAPKT